MHIIIRYICDFGSNRIIQNESTSITSCNSIHRSYKILYMHVYNIDINKSLFFPYHLSLPQTTMIYYKLTVTGASTRCTFPSSTKISRARKQSALTSFSRRYSHRFNRSICESSEVTEPLLVLLEAEVVAGCVVEALGGGGAVPTEVILYF